MTEYLYRIESTNVGGELSSRVCVYVHRYPIVRRTPCGFVISIYGTMRFVLKNGKKRFALESIEEATKSFHARKERQKMLASATARHAEAALDTNPLHYVSTW